MQGLHRRLVGSGCGDPFDRHVFACAITVAVDDPGRPLTAALGLSPSVLADIVAAYFPEAWWHLPPLARGDDAGDDQIEEPDLRRLLVDHRSGDGPEPVWLSAIIARRSQSANHLWQDLGLFDRGELNALMERHFRPLKRRNSGDMKWKKFFYRLLCEQDGLVVCKAPTCDACDDVGLCFGPEAGETLSVLRATLSEIRQTGRFD